MRRELLDVCSVFGFVILTKNSPFLCVPFLRGCES